MPLLLAENVVPAIPDLTALGVAGMSVWGLITVVKLASHEREQDRKERTADRELRQAEATASEVIARANEQSIAVLREAIEALKEHMARAG